MRKRVLSLCMAFVLCLTMLPAAAFAEETQSVNEAVTQSSKVAQVGEETYDTLKEALDAAQTGTVTITLLEDATLDEDYSIVWESGVTKDITIAMGNHSVTGNGTLVIEDGTVHLTGSGTFGAPITYTGATLSLTEGWTGTASSITSTKKYRETILELSGGTVTDLTYVIGDLAISDGEVGTLHVNTETISTITGGHFGTITAGTDNVTFFPSAGNVFLSDGKPFNTIQAGESIYNVTLGACTHSDDNGDTICDYCHAVANVELYAADDTLRRGCFGITEALGYVQSGDTIRIGDNQTETATVDKNFPFVIHLSGNYLPGLTVNNDGLRLMGTMVDANNNTVYGSIGELSIPGSMIGSLPADGYSLAAYKDSSTLGTWLTADELLSNHATNVSVVKAAIEHVRVVNSVSVPYGTAPTFTAEVTSENTDGLTYQWYKLENGSWTAIFGANEKTYEPTGLNAGTYDFICAVTGADGATVLGNIGNVTVEPVSIAGATVVADRPLYNGTAQSPAVIITLDGRPLSETTDYTVNVTPQINVNGNGNYTLSVEGKGNYTGEVNGVEWNLVPIVLGTLNFEVSTLLKSYDGTTEIDPEIREFLGEDGTNTYTLVRGTDYSLTAGYVEPDVLGAEKSKIEYTVKLISKNYVLSLGDGKTGDTVQGTLNGTITKAAAPMQTNGTLLVTNHLERTYTCDLSKWLIVLGAGKTYGTIGYELDKVALNEGYYTSGAKIENGQLILPVNAVDSSTESSIGTVTVKVTTTNYEDMTLTVNVNAVNRIAPVGEPTLSKTTISYGEKIGSITISGVMKDGDQDVAGTFAWADGDVRPSVGNGICYAAWNFTPEDTGRYLVATGTSIITVTKATPTGAPGYTPITASGKTLADAALTAEDTKNQSLFAAFGTAVPGKVKWVDKDGNDLTAQSADIEVKQGESYYWLFTPTDTENYHTLNGTIILWAQTTPSGGGGGGGTSAPAPADNDVKPVERELTQTIAELLARNTDADLVVKISNVEVTLNSRTLETIASEAKGDKIRIVVTENAGLSESQKPVENLIGKNGSIFDLTIYVGDKRLHDFKGGEAHVSLPVPEELKGKDVVVIYISDDGICEILNHSMETVGTDSFIRFTTSHFSNFAVVEKAEAEKLIAEQNQQCIKAKLKQAKFQVTTSKTKKQSVKVQVAAKNDERLLSDMKAMGYTVRYQFCRSTKKASGYKVLGTKNRNTFIDTKGTAGKKYYYKARVLVYDGKKLIAKSTLKQCSYGK